MYEPTLSGSIALIHLRERIANPPTRRHGVAVTHLRRGTTNLGPAEDGGYYLLGLRRPAAELFEGIEWSTSTVLGETRRRLAALRWHCHELPTRWDVDRQDDYRRMQQEGLWPAGNVGVPFQ